MSLLRSLSAVLRSNALRVFAIGDVAALILR